MTTASRRNDFSSSAFVCGVSCSSMFECAPRLDVARESAPRIYRRASHAPMGPWSDGLATANASGPLPHDAVLGDQRIERCLVVARAQERQEAVREADADGRRPRRQRRERAVEEATAVTEPRAAGAEAEAGNDEQLGDELLGALGLGDVVRVELGLAARIPDVEAQRPRRPIGDRQADAANAAVDRAFAPAVERRQRIELALDRPVRADRAL